MKTVKVQASKSYDVIIGASLLPCLGEYLAKVTKAKKIAIVSDSNVWPLYGKAVTDALAGYETLSFVFPAGEESKNGETYLKLLNFLAENKLTRSDCLVALGGGVVGDLTGFAAATYLRGVDFVQVPTTLLAAVDSSVGGKTAIDLDAGKNLAGAFYQPSLVLCDLDTLNTLPENIFRDGCAEVIKYGVLYDEALFTHLEEKGLGFDREAVIARCVELKRDVVAQDEFDRGERQKLNLGHTVGHGIEACSGYRVSHGSAVAAGMGIVSRAAAKLGICSQGCAEKIEAVIRAFGLPVNSEFSAKELYLCALSDKKRSGGTVNLILPEKIGFCRIAPTKVEDVQALIEMGK